MHKGRSGAGTFAANGRLPNSPPLPDRDGIEVLGIFKEIHIGSQGHPATPYRTRPQGVLGSPSSTAGGKVQDGGRDAERGAPNSNGHSATTSAMVYGMKL